MDRLHGLISIVVKAKRTPSTSQSKQLQDMAQDLKIHLARLHAKHLQLQGMYLERSRTVKKLIRKGSTNTHELKDVIAQELAKIAPQKMAMQPSPMTYSAIAKISQAQPKTAKTKVLLVYPKENKKDQSSEETKRDLRSHLQPQHMKLQINRMSNIRNGGISLEVPTNKAVDLIQKLNQCFETRQPKQTNKILKLLMSLLTWTRNNSFKRYMIRTFQLT